MITKTCKYCGEVFEVEIGKRDQMFCSAKCQGRHHSETSRENSQFICEECGKSFYAPPSTNRRFCSQECATKRAINKCVHCGKAFEVSWAKQSITLFCSKACYDASRQKTYQVYVPREKAAKRSNHIEITPEIQEYIDGLLLSDGSIALQSTMHSAYLKVGLGSKSEDWALKIREDLENLGVKFGKNYRSKDGTAFGISSISYAEFCLFRQRWYPNGLRRVPRDFALTPIVVKNWYLGDGVFYRYSEKAGKNSNISIITLATNRFPKEDVEYLSSLLKKEIGIEPNINYMYLKYPQPIIRINKQDDVERFLRYIGDIDLESLRHKTIEGVIIE